MIRFAKYKLAVAGVVIVGIIVLFSMFAPMLSPYSYEEQHVMARNLPASFSHLFGTDKFGRDLFVRVWTGTRISLLIGVFSAFLNTVIGVVYGCITGYAGGKTDLILMRLADIIDAIPSLLYVILITLVLGGSVCSILTGICVSGWIGMSRIVRTEVMRLKEQEFCISARMSGARAGWIICRHILPNAAGPVIVNATFLIPQAIFTEAFLSFTGVGIAPPLASLGTLIAEARSQIQLYPAQILYPVIVLCMTICGLTFVGNGLEKLTRTKEER